MEILDFIENEIENCRFRDIKVSKILDLDFSEVNYGDVARLCQLLDAVIFSNHLNNFDRLEILNIIKTLKDTI